MISRTIDRRVACVPSGLWAPVALCIRRQLVPGSRALVWDFISLLLSPGGRCRFLVRLVAEAATFADDDLRKSRCWHLPRAPCIYKHIYLRRVHIAHLTYYPYSFVTRNRTYRAAAGFFGVRAANPGVYVQRVLSKSGPKKGPPCTDEISFAPLPPRAAHWGVLCASCFCCVCVATSVHRLCCCEEDGGSVRWTSNNNNNGRCQSFCRTCSWELRARGQSISRDLGWYFCFFLNEYIYIALNIEYSLIHNFVLNNLKLSFRST